MTNKNITRKPDCVTEVRMGNTILVVSGFFKEHGKETFTDKMRKTLEMEHLSRWYETCAG